MTKLIYYSILIFIASFFNEPNFIKKYDTIFIGKERFIVDGFDFPVGKPNAKGYYNAQKFTVNHHLGEDWNAVTGGNSDLGHPIYSTAHGVVTSAKNEGGGWGNVIRVVHKTNLEKYPYVESFYAHCDTILVQKGQFIKRGEQIGTIGNNNGQYYAHLHFEMRWNVDMKIGGGYSQNIYGYLNPTKFIQKNRTKK